MDRINNSNTNFAMLWKILVLIKTTDLLRMNPTPNADCQLIIQMLEANLAGECCEPVMTR